MPSGHLRGEVFAIRRMMSDSRFLLHRHTYERPVLWKDTILAVPEWGGEPTECSVQEDGGHHRTPWVQCPGDRSLLYMTAVNSSDENALPARAALTWEITVCSKHLISGAFLLISRSLPVHLSTVISKPGTTCRFTLVRVSWTVRIRKFLRLEPRLLLKATECVLLGTDDTHRERKMAVRRHQAGAWWVKYTLPKYSDLNSTSGTIVSWV